MPRLHPPQYVVTGVEFGHLSVEDIRTLSVAKISKQTTFNEHGRPADRGLHDLRLGSFQSDRCATCHQSTWHCDGHPGHIDLPLACYHPLFFDQILRLLRAQCVYCQRLQLPKVQVNRYTCMLRLLQHGLIEDMLALENMHIRKVDRNATNAVPSGLLSPPSGSDSDGVDMRMELEPEDGVEEDPEDFMNRRNRYVKVCLKRANAQRKAEPEPVVNFKSTIAAEERRRVIRQFLADIAKSKKCPHCLGESPGVRKEKFTKLYRKQLGQKSKDRMIQGGFEIPNPVVLIVEKRKLEQEVAKGGVDLHGAEEEIARAKAVRSEAKKSDRNEQFNGRYLSPVEVYASIVLLIESEQELFDLVYSSRPTPKGTKVATADMFFIRSLLVPPNRYRPEAAMGDSKMSEDPQNTIYMQILRHSDMIRLSRDEQLKGLKSAAALIRNQQFLTNSIVKLQESVNQLIDKTKNPNAGTLGPASAEGIKQKLEKKEGLFRHNMMGKRVNYAARTVLSPDVYLETNEVGIPKLFAKKLVFPVPVTEKNHAQMKEYVINGYWKYPGATIIENEHGKVLSLKAKTLDQRIALANDLLTPLAVNSTGARPNIVHRHLISGDWVLMNRQPTLHKPSIMGHKARVLDSDEVENTFRMHYTNCNTYNADFDGDEMNLHFPQTNLAQCEASMIADTDHQYLSATSGKPLRGLIQDHISGGTWLTGKDTMFDAEEYMHLLYAALRPEDGHTTYHKILMVKPAIIRPKRMWTGKQVISSILKNIRPEDLEPLNMKGKTQTEAWSWGEASEEGEFIIQEGELVCGVLDKAQLGATEGGLISCVHEIYGPKVAGNLIGILGRLLTKFQNIRPFTCGLDDLFLTKEGEFERAKKLKEADRIGHETHLKYVLLDKNSRKRQKRELRKRLAAVFQVDDHQRMLDLLMNAQTAALSTEITRECMPKRLAKKFPKNGMQTMTISGAKGSKVNANLISCNLGQQVLEGRRVPVMPSGKTLPCFKPFETRPIAGGYIASRFLTGLKPQEYYFHAMAGREGLIDTAVKTSRSGYLQRCLVKGMEGIKAEYDGTVRDADSSVVQFLYGEDGLEVTKAKSFTKFPLLAQNYVSVTNALQGSEAWNLIGEGYSALVEENKKAEKGWRRAGGKLDATDPIISKHNPRSRVGAVSESFLKSVTMFLDEDPDNLVKSKKKPKGVIAKPTFRALMDLKYMQSIIEPGEAVGVVAAQSVGEPSTQMTLNTFHLAGHSAKNVTLGIPRLREIVMTASAKLKTPVMTLPLIEELPHEEGLQFSRMISKFSFAECIDSLSFREAPGEGPNGARSRVYDIRIQFFPAKQYMVEYEVTPDQLAHTMEEKFIPDLVTLIRKDVKKKKKEWAGEIVTEAFPDLGQEVDRVLEGEGEASGTQTGNLDADDSDYDRDDDDAENDAKAAMRLANRKAAQGYDDPDKEEEEMIRELAEPYSGSEIDSDDEEKPTTGSNSEDGESSDRESSKQTSKDPHGRHASRQDGTIYLAEGDRSKPAVEREKNLLEKYIEVARFRFDDEGGWATFRLTYEEGSPKFLMMPHIETASGRAIVKQTPKLGKAQFIVEKKFDLVTKKEAEIPTIVTEGVNLDVIRTWQHMINPHKFVTNDIVSMLKRYGVEAARATIVSELTAVFKSHGIAVDARHLNLIADTMTRGGGFTPFSRTGLKGASVSPFMKMSFETTFGFLKDAVDDQDWDDLSSPSARIVMGKADKSGTGSFAILNRLDQEYFEAARKQLKAQKAEELRRANATPRERKWDEYDEEFVEEFPTSRPGLRRKRRKIEVEADAEVPSPEATVEADVKVPSSEATVVADEMELASPSDDESTSSESGSESESESDESMASGSGIEIITTTLEWELDVPPVPVPEPGPESEPEQEPEVVERTPSPAPMEIISSPPNGPIPYTSLEELEDAPPLPPLSNDVEAYEGDGETPGTTLARPQPSAQHPRTSSHATATPRRWRDLPRSEQGRRVSEFRRRMAEYDEQNLLDPDPDDNLPPMQPWSSPEPNGIHPLRDTFSSSSTETGDPPPALSNELNGNEEEEDIALPNGISGDEEGEQEGEQWALVNGINGQGEDEPPTTNRNSSRRVSREDILAAAASLTNGVSYPNLEEPADRSPPPAADDDPTRPSRTLSPPMRDGTVHAHPSRSISPLTREPDTHAHPEPQPQPPARPWTSIFGPFGFR